MCKKIQSWFNKKPLTNLKTLTDLEIRAFSKETFTEHNITYTKNEVFDYEIFDLKEMLTEWKVKQYAESKEADIECMNLSIFKWRQVSDNEIIKTYTCKVLSYTGAFEIQINKCKALSTLLSINSTSIRGDIEIMRIIAIKNYYYDKDNNVFTLDFIAIVNEKFL